MVFAPEISPPVPPAVMPFAVIVTIVLPDTFARILPLAPEKYTLLVPLLIYEPEPPPPVIVALLTAVILPLAAIVITGTVVVLPY